MKLSQKAIQTLFSHPLSGQIIRFGLVGISAALVQFLGVAGFVSFFHLKPLIANCFAFLFAFQVSFLGHTHWTFKAKNSAQTKRKFFVVSSCSFALNQTLYAYLLKYSHLHYLLALLIVILIVPGLTFLLSKFWAFRGAVASNSTSNI
jgi:putative flippase GtrA